MAGSTEVSELFTTCKTTAKSVNDEPEYTTDFYRCGKCSVEYSLLEDFIWHKIIEEKNSLVLWESVKISGIQIPRFAETTVNICIHTEEVSSKITSQIVHQDQEKQLLHSYNHIETNISASVVTNQTKTNSASIDPEIKKSSLSKTCFSPITDRRKVNTSTFKKETRVTAGLLEQLAVVAKQKSARQEPACHICGSIYRDFTTLTTHIKTVHSKERPFKCNFSGCLCAFKTKASLQRHERRHTGELPFSCEACGRSFRESGTLARHLKARVPCKKSGVTDLSRLNKNQSVSSFLKNSGNDSITENSRSDSKESHTSPPETMQIIITKMPDTQNNIHIPSAQVENKQRIEYTSNHQSLDSHSAPDQFSQLLEVVTRLRPETSSPDPVLPEPVVPEPVTKSLDPKKIRDVLTQQIIDHSLKCNVCEEISESPLCFSQHLQSHLKNLNFRCSRCYFVCEDKKTLLEHTKNMHERNASSSKEPVDDERCCFQEVVLQLLTLHDILDEQEAKVSDNSATSKRNCGAHRCHVCLKKFSGRSYFSLHMGNHTGEQPYSCEFCPRAFITKDSLQKHLISHSEHRSFKCNICNRLFKRANHIREHLRTHSNEKYFFCKICGKGFKWQGAQKSHEMTHNRLATFVCECCGRRFRSRSSMKRHARRHLTATQSLEPAVIRNVGESSTARDDNKSGDLQLMATTSDIAEEEPTFLLILEDGNTCLGFSPEGMVSFLNSTSTIWRPEQPQTDQDQIMSDSGCS